MFKKSNAPFTDIRSADEKALYSKQQADSRKMRADRSQFERYRARLGDEAPKTFTQFRKLKKQGGEKWEELQKLYRSKFPKTVDNSGGSGIIKEREYEFGVPYGKYSINADMDYINSDEYAAKFNKITDNEYVNKTLLECAREAIAHRNGSKYEDMYFIHAETGEILAKQLDMTFPSGISYNDEIKALLIRAKKENIPLVTLHNHPEGYPPSVDDLNKSFENNTIFGISVGHNGQVYRYNRPGKYIENAKDIHDDIAFRYMAGADVDRAYTEMYDILGIGYTLIGKG